MVSNKEFSDLIRVLRFPLCVMVLLIHSHFESIKVHDYVAKLKSRAKSLLLPLIFWNLVFILMLYIKQTFVGIGEHKLVVDYSLKDWFLVFVNQNSSGLPINTPLWFVRDLIVMVLISPLCTISLLGCAFCQLGLVLVLNRECTVAIAEVYSGL